MLLFSRLRQIFLVLFVLTATLVVGSNLGWAVQRTNPAIAQHNAVIFVADGLRSSVVNAADMPTLHSMQSQGVDFVNSHSLFPTFTTANASAIATGHYLGDTGDFSNTIDVGFPTKSARGSRVPFLENNAVLAEVNQRYESNYLSEESLLATARKAGFSTAAVGKVGPVLIQDITQTTGEPTIIIDDATGSATGVPLSAEVTSLLQAKALPLETPSRGANGKSGNSTQAGAKVPNLTQQQYFADVTTKAILPIFKQRQQPFVLVYWSRDPDGTQHNQGDSLNQLVPGINGPTSQAARQNADKNLAQLRTALKQLGLAATTNIFVIADHGFSTISKESKTSYAATLSYPDVPKGFLPPGFLAIDIAHALGMPMFDPDQKQAAVNPEQGGFSKNAVIGPDPDQPSVVVAGNGGSDLLYVAPGKELGDRKLLTQKIVATLMQQDYTSGVFVDDSLQPIPGTLPLSAIGLRGTARMPTPAIVVSFRSFDTGCGNPVACAVEVADTPLQQGQGMHGSFSRADTQNAMAAIGPDFKAKFIDRAPVSNADVAMTIARVLKLQIPHRGSLRGRILLEALARGTDQVIFKSQQVESQPAANGLKTVLNYQTVGNTRYFTAAGFRDRTVGLAPGLTASRQPIIRP